MYTTTYACGCVERGPGLAPLYAKRQACPAHKQAATRSFVAGEKALSLMYGPSAGYEHLKRPEISLNLEATR